MHSGNVYDVTEFSDRHPGGKEWLLKYSGQDVTRVMQELTPHKHTKVAYSMMEKYRVSDLPEEDRKQVTETSHIHTKHARVLARNPELSFPVKNACHQNKKPTHVQFIVRRARGLQSINIKVSKHRGLVALALFVRGRKTKAAVAKKKGSD